MILLLLLFSIPPNTPFNILSEIFQKILPFTVSDYAISPYCTHIPKSSIRFPPILWNSNALDLHSPYRIISISPFSWSTIKLAFEWPMTRNRLSAVELGTSRFSACPSSTKQSWPLAGKQGAGRLSHSPDSHENTQSNRGSGQVRGPNHRFNKDSQCSLCMFSFDVESFVDF